MKPQLLTQSQLSQLIVKLRAELKLNEGPKRWVYKLPTGQGLVVTATAARGVVRALVVPKCPC